MCIRPSASSLRQAQGRTSVSPFPDTKKHRPEKDGVLDKRLFKSYITYLRLFRKLSAAREDPRSTTVAPVSGTPGFGPGVPLP